MYLCNCYILLLFEWKIKLKQDKFKIQWFMVFIGFYLVNLSSSHDQGAGTACASTVPVMHSGQRESQSPECHVRHVRHVGKTMPWTTHDWEWFIPSMYGKATIDRKFTCSNRRYSKGNVGKTIPQTIPQSSAYLYVAKTIPIYGWFANVNCYFTHMTWKFRKKTQNMMFNGMTPTKHWHSFYHWCTTWTRDSAGQLNRSSCRGWFYSLGIHRYFEEGIMVQSNMWAYIYIYIASYRCILPRHKHDMTIGLMIYENVGIRTLGLQRTLAKEIGYT